MASRGAIQQGETVAVPRTRGLSLPFDPVLLLAVLALAACSLVTVAAATADDVAGNPHYFVTRQALYFGAGGVLAILLWRMDYSRLREVKLVTYGLLIASIMAVMAFGSVARVLDQAGRVETVAPYDADRLGYPQLARLTRDPGCLFCQGSGDDGVRVLGLDLGELR